MISFKEFLHEAGPRDSDRRQELDVSEASLALTKYCAQALEQARYGHVLYRGTESRGTPFLKYNTEGRPARPSKARYNEFYGKALEELPEWKKLPRRQMICGTTSKVALEYSEKNGDAGVVLLIFPKDNTKICVCPTNDIQTSFPVIHEAGFTDLQAFNYSCEKVFTKGLGLSRKNFLSYSQGMTAQKISESTGPDADKQKILALLKITGGKTMYAAIEEALATSQFKFQTPAKDYPSDREVWFDGSSIAVAAEESEALHKLINKLDLDPDLFSFSTDE